MRNVVCELSRIPPSADSLIDTTATTQRSRLLDLPAFTARMAHPQLYVLFSQPPSHELSEHVSRTFRQPPNVDFVVGELEYSGTNSHHPPLNAVIHSRIPRNCAWTPRSATCRRSRRTSPKLAPALRTRSHTGHFTTDSRSALSPTNEGQVGPR